MCHYSKTTPISFTIAVALFALTARVSAQDVGSIVGSLMDEMTRTPLVGASVSLIDHELSAVTNEDGHFAILDVPTGDVSVRMEHLGHITVVVQVSVPAQEVAFVQAELSPMAVLLRELRVVADRRPPIRDGAAVTEFRPTERESAYTAMELLGARIPSLRIQGGENGTRSRTDIRIRGSGSVSGSNQPTLYVDGVKTDLEFLTELPSTDIIVIRVLRGPSASALYQNAVNGVILVETLRGRLPVKRPRPPPV